MSYSKRLMFSRSPAPYKRYSRLVSRSLSRSRSSSRSRSRSRSSDVENPGNNLYVTGLSTRVTKRELEDHFAAKGKVVDVHLVVDPWTRESRGFGFVAMSTVGEADRCIKYLNRSVLGGRVITVEKAKTRRGRTPTPGSYSPHQPPSYFPYRSYMRRWSRSPSWSPSYSSECSRSSSYSPYYRRHRSYSPNDYSRRRYHSRSQSPYSRSPVSRRNRSYSPYDFRYYSPDDRYYRRYHYRSASRSPTPHRVRRSSRRSYLCSTSVSPRRNSGRSYSHSVSPPPRRSLRRSYSPRISRSYSKSVSPRPRKNLRRSGPVGVLPGGGTRKTVALGVLVLVLLLGLFLGLLLQGQLHHQRERGSKFKPA